MFVFTEAWSELVWQKQPKFLFRKMFMLYKDTASIIPSEQCMTSCGEGNVTITHNSHAAISVLLRWMQITFHRFHCLEADNEKVCYFNVCLWASYFAFSFSLSRVSLKVITNTVICWPIDCIYTYGQTLYHVTSPVSFWKAVLKPNGRCHAG